MGVTFVTNQNFVEKDTGSKPYKPDIPALTGLRFIAAFLVFISHAPKPAWVYAVIPANILGVGFGYFGVTIFFILSGFVITLNYYAWFGRGKALRNVKRYAVARFARIYPVAFFALLLVFFTEPTVNLRPDFPVLILFHLTLLQAWFPNFNDSIYVFNGVAWSVSCEVFFYFAFPFVARFLLPRLKTLFSLWAVIFLTIITVLGIETYLYIDTLLHGNSERTTYLIFIFPPVRFLDFFLGCLISRVFIFLKDRPITRRERISANIILSVVLFLAFFLWINFDTSYGFYYFDGPFIIPFGYLIFYLARYPLSGVFRVILSSKFILLGEASYSFYLLHEFVIQITEARLKSSDDFLFSIGYFCLLVFLVILISLAAYKYIEVPARRFIRQKWG